MEIYTTRKIQRLFASDITPAAIRKAEAAGHIPQATRAQSGNKKRRWVTSDLPLIGERYGFMKGKPKKKPVVVSVFTTKGGVLKTTVSLNLARMAALHNHRVLVIGLDMQCDLTNALGMGLNIDEESGLDEAMTHYEEHVGLASYERDKVIVSSLVRQTDIPTLDIIPETPELQILEKNLGTRRLGEFWLRDNVIEPLGKKYDLVLLDCSPNWNELVSNALISTDLLISPLECKINHHRNFEAFYDFIRQFQSETQHQFETIFVPTKLAPSQRLSSEIRQWYLKNVPKCSSTAIRESVIGEDSMARNISFLEFDPAKLPAEEMRELLREIWGQLIKVGE